jgi:DNA primase
MPRIADEVIERLKAEVAVERLAEARGVVFEKRGTDLHGRCPFHEDRTPSLVVTPSKNLWHCLGACQQGGTAIDWVMKAEGVSFRHAVELLQNDYQPIAPATSGAAPKHSTVRKLPTMLERDAEDVKLLGQVVDYYHETLLGVPEALAYLTRRGIGSKAAIETFWLGYANRTLGYRLPAKTRIEGEAIRGQLQRVGLIRASGHEHFSGSLVIPVIDEHGAVTEVYGRKLLDNLRPGTPKHLYLPGPHRGVWNAAALTASSEIILCEALIDALTFWCAGYRNVTASYGVEGFTADHLAAFKEHGTERVLIAYDRDEAGDKAAEKLAAKLQAEGLDCYRILFPKGMDANEYALKVGPAEKSLGVAIRSAQWMGKGAPKARAASVAESVIAEPASDLTRAPDPLNSLAAEEAAKDKTTHDAPEPAMPRVPEPPLPTLPAHVIPEPAMPSVTTEQKPLGAEHEHTVTFGARRYRVRGLEKNASYECLKVNVLVSAPSQEGGEAVHVDTLDLYQARHRAAFIAAASVELGVAGDVIKADLAKLLLALETEQEKLLSAAREPVKPAPHAMSEDARAAALELLRDGKLIERIASDFSRAGIVGETSNALVGYLAAVSRKLDRPLALLIQSTSAAGKSSLLDAVLRFIPEEDRVVYSAMTGQSLFYMGEMNLKHKLLAIAEQEGAARATYALKLLQSEGELTIASTSKDATTGKLVTEEYRVEGPVMIALTTTAAEIDEELLNRCLVLTIDEGRQQTQAIHTAQRARRTLGGLLAKAEREAILSVHQNAQRLLEPLAVVNPFADKLTFLDDRTRTRRDHEKYLTLIDVIALLHQHQRVLRTANHGGRTIRYVEATLDDIALANELAHEVLGRTLDELPPQTRRLLGLVIALVDEECAKHNMCRAQHRFSRRELRERTKWSDTQLKIHLSRLVELEYLLLYRGGRGLSFEYELLYDGQADGIDGKATRVSGLIDVEALRVSVTPFAAQSCNYEVERSGLNEHRSGSGRPPVGGRSGGGRDAKNASPPEESSPLAASRVNGAENAHYRVRDAVASYVVASPPSV